MQVGVIIPNHNYGKWLTNALDSVLNQSYKPSRIIVVDDGSSDDSLGIISRFTNQTWELFDSGKCVIDTTVKDIPFYAVHWNKARGPSSARNYAIGLMSHDENISAYAFLDSDDYYLTGYLEKTMEVLNNDPTYVGVVYVDSMIYDVHTQSEVPRYWEPFDRAKLVDGNRLSMNSVVNRKAIDECGMFDADLRTLEDWDLWLRISEKYVLVHVPEILVTQRNHNSNSLSVVNQEKWKTNWEKVMKKAYTRMYYGK